MKKTTLLSLTIVAIMLFPFFGCGNNDDESILIVYTEPMENNPVKSITWLAEAKDEAKQRVDEWYADNRNSSRNFGASVKLYSYDGQDYYEVRYGDLEKDSGLKFNELNFQADIYDSQGNPCVSIIGGDAVGTRPGYEHLQGFWQIATLKKLLWEYKKKN